MSTKIAETNQHQEHHEGDDKVLFGFWVYLMTDLLMFAALFASFAVLSGNTFGELIISF